LAAVTGLADWRRRRPPLQGEGATMPGWVRTLQIIFVVAVAFIAAVVLYGPKPAMNARYFPQPLTSFTLDALGVFYLSLSLSVLFMIRQRGMATLVTYLRGAIGLVAIIVIATLLNIGIFHFSAHPRHVVYLATYVVVMIGTVVILWWDRRETSRAATPAGLPGVQGPAGTPA
jgi:CDP-diglyceride synthetase